MSISVGVDKMMLFVGSVHAVPIAQKGHFAAYEGVVVNVVSLSQSSEMFIDNVVAELSMHCLALVEISDIKTIFRRQISSYKTISMRKTIRRAWATKSTQFEIFYAYGSQ